MLLIIEIALTISAWRKGWRAKALVPGAIALAIGFVLGAVLSGGGASTGALVAVSILLDFTLIAMLSWMVRHAPQPETAVVLPQPSAPADAVQAYAGSPDA